MQKKPTYEELVQRVKVLEKNNILHKKAEQTLQEKEAFYRYLVKNANDIIYRTDAAGNFIYLNPISSKITGYLQKDLSKMHYLDLVHPDYRQEAKRFYNLQFIKNIASTYYEFPLLKKDGSKIWIGQHVQLIIDDNQVTGFFAVGREITRRKQTEKALKDSEEKYRTILENMQEGFFEIDLAGNFTFFNNSLCRILEYPKKEKVGKHYREYMDADNAEKVSRLFHKLYTSHKPQKGIVWTFLSRKKTKKHVEVSVSLIKDSKDRPIGFRGIIWDITKRKFTENELKKYQEQLEELVNERTAELKREIAERKRIEIKTIKLNEELEQRVKERTAELEKAYRELKKVDKLKDSFLSSVSHELRTPLTSIRSFSEILLQYQDEDLATKQEFLDIINSESERLTRLINDVLDLSRIEAGGMLWDDKLISLEKIINNAVKAQYQLLQDNNLRLKLDIAPNLPLVFIDPDRIQQVITNLLGNSIKFSFSGKEICVRAEIFKGKRSGESAGWIIVSIVDQGIGLEEQDFEIVFDKFRQVSSDATKNKPKGTGLGLPICKEIITHYGGNIWVEAPQKKGCIFHFTIPTAKAASSGAPADSDKKEQLKI